MTFIDRLGNGLYWAGCFFTVLFAACALMALDSDPDSNETTIAAKPVQRKEPIGLPTISIGLTER